MEYPLLSEYQEAILNAEDNFDQLANLRPVLDAKGRPVMSSGNFAVVFKMTDGNKDYAVKCFLREQKGRAIAYKQICEYLSSVHSKYLVHTEYMEKELFVDTNQSKNEEFPILKMDWVDGCTLEEYVYQNLGNKECIIKLCEKFENLIKWLLPSHIAHGDLKPDNIIVTPKGDIVLIDYDGMFVPMMWGQDARENGTPQFQYQWRTSSEFNEYIDDYAGLYLALIIKIITIDNQPMDFYLSMDKETLIAYASRFINDISISKLLSAFLLVNSLGFVEREALQNVFYDEQKRNRALELKLLHEALEGNTQAMVQLGATYSRGNFTPVNNLKALEYYYTAKLMGNANAACGVCRHFYHFQNDYFDKKEYCNNPIHRTMCDRSIEFSLCREAEEHLSKDTAHAKDFFSKAALLNFAPAINWLSTFDKTNEISLLQHAAELGHALSNKKLARYYQEGKYVSQDAEKFLKYLQCAADLGDDEAQYKIGLTYLNPNTISWSDAVDWFRKSAQQGNTNAICQLFVCYATGNGVKQDYNKAFSLINHSFSSSSRIYFLLGFCYEHGKGTNTNYQKACYYYQKSIHEGYSLAEIKLEQLCKRNNLKDETGVELSEIKSIGNNYSLDGQRFLSYDRPYDDEYSVADGTKVLCDDSFNDLYCESEGFCLKKLILPESLERIGNNVFCGSILEIECKSPYFVVKDNFLLSEDKKILYRYFGESDVLDIPSTVIYIKGGAFSDKQIRKIHIPKSVMFIGDNPFVGIYSTFEDYGLKLETTIENESKYFKMIDGVLYDIKEKRLIALLETKTKICIARGTKEIGRNAFWNSNVEVIDFSMSQVEKIHETAFYWCDKLQRILISRDDVYKFKNMLPVYVQDRIVEK